MLTAPEFPFARHNSWQQIQQVVTGCMSQRIRTLREFAEQEIILPEGPYEGRRFRCYRQPFSGLLFDEMQRWRRVAVTGTVQSGKSLCAFVVPILYYLFERRENVIMAGPTVELLNDKWNREVLPVVNRNATFRALIPETGRGSRGGRIESIQFQHGPVLKFMSGGGGDEKRSSYTARILIVTETDKMDDQSELSREADKISQLEARTAAFGEDARIVLECTTSYKTGRIWREYTTGTETRIVCPCPHCHEYVSPERADFRGWETTADEIGAAKTAGFFCPGCGELLTDRHRQEMNRQGRLLHKGQTIDKDGTVQGDAPPVLTLGFRWSAFHNLFWTSPFLGVKAWRGLRSEDEDSAEKEACQFVWSVPYEPKDNGDTAGLTVEAVIERQSRLPRGHVPDGTQQLTLGIDIGKRLAHWTAVCFLPADRTAHVLDYGRLEIASDDLGFERAIQIALADFRDRLAQVGWSRSYDRVLVDVRWKTDSILAALKDLKDNRWRAAMGLGDAHYQKKTYIQPDKITGTVIKIGHRWFERIRRIGSQRIIMVDANYWKSQVHDRLTLPFSRQELQPAPGGIGLFSSLDPNEHLSYAKHLTAEREVLKFEPGRGHVKVWEAVRESNHWLDSTALALVAGSTCGFSFEPRPAAVRPGAGVGPLQHGDDPFTYDAPILTQGADYDRRRS